MKYWAMVLAAAIAFALLPSCQEKSETSHRVVVTAVGIDSSEKGCRLSIQAVEPLLTSGSLTEQDKNPTTVYDLEGDSVAGILDTFVTRTGRLPYILHNRAMVIGLKEAKALPLTTLLDYFIRNHEGRSTVDIVICRGEASALLRVPTAGYTIPADQLSMLLEEGRRRGYTVSADLLDVERSFSGMFDMALPIVRVEGEGEETSLAADGTAVFRQGRYVGELDEAGTRGLLLGRGDMESCVYTLDGITVQLHDCKAHVTVTREGGSAVIGIKVSCQGFVVEKTGPEKLSGEELERVSRRLEEAIRTDTEGTLNTTIKEWGCDLYGFSRMIKKKIPALTRDAGEEWPERLRECTFRVETAVRLTQ